MSRIDSHKIETNSKNRFRIIIDLNNYCDALIRDITERDYGIDFIMELFENNNPTGMIAFIQLKGKQESIKQNKRSNDVSCSGISINSLQYGNQRIIPYIIVYLSIKNEEFYFIDLQSVVKEIKNNNDRKSCTVRIPADNRCNKDDVKKFIDVVKKYYNQ